MLDAKQLGEALSDQTRAKILQKLGQQSLTTTELYKLLPEIKYRESVFKALEKLRRAGLVKRTYSETKKSFKYKLAFKTIKINQKIEVEMQ